MDYFEILRCLRNAYNFGDFVEQLNDCHILKRTVKGKGKGRFMGLFNTAAIRPIVFLPPNKFLHSSPEAPRIIQMRKTSTSEGGNYYQ